MPIIDDIHESGVLQGFLKTILKGFDGKNLKNSKFDSRPPPPPPPSLLSFLLRVHHIERHMVPKVQLGNNGGGWGAPFDGFLQ